MGIFKKFQKSQQFDHLAKSVKAGKSQGVRIMMVGLICFFSLGVLLILMLNYSNQSSAKSINQKSQANQINQINPMSRIFEENENKIKELQQVTQSLIHMKNLSVSPGAGGMAGITADPSNSGSGVSASQLLENANWRARESAKTEVYSQSTEGAFGNGEALNRVESAEKVSRQLLKSEPGLLGQYQNMEASTAEEMATSLGVLMQHPDDTIAQGELIHAVLETAVNSELPGMVRAEITDPIYAYRGKKVLIPAGSRLVGQYASKLQNGPSSARIFIMWNRIITPQGLSILINSPGVDALGRSGLSADAINHHFFQIFGQAVLLSVIGGGASSWGVSEDAQPNSVDQFRQSISESFQDSASKSLQSNSENISPTLHIYQGDPVVIFVSKDLDLFEALHPSLKTL